MVSWGNLYSKGQQEGKTICFAESGAPDKMRLEQAQIRSTPPIMENPIKQTPPIRQMKLQAFTRSSLWVRRYQAQASLDRRLAAIAAALVAMAVPAESALLTHLSLDTADGLTLNGDAAITTGGLGKFGEALTLDGTGDWADVAANNPVTGGAVRTVSAWVFQVAPPTVTNKIATVIGIGTNNTTPGGQKWDFEIDNAFGGIEVGVGGGRNAGTGLTESELTGNWMLLVSTLPVAGGTVGDVKTYWNGAVTNAGTGTKLIDTVGAKFDLGVSANGSLASQPQHLNGRIDDVAIWNEALTTDEIKGLYEVGNSSELSYTAGNFDQVKQVHDAALGSVVVGSTEWTYATGLTGPAGLTGGSGSFTLVLDEAAGTGLTGVAVTEKVPFAISSITAVGGGVWELSLIGPAGVTCEFRSSTTLDFIPGTLVENLTQGNPGSDPGTIGGPNNSRVTTNGSGNATVRMSLTGNPSDFVRAQTVP
jgi:hypothetical protein